MTAYVLCSTNAVSGPIGTAQVGSKGMNLPAGSNFIDLSIGGALNPVIPPTNQTFQLIVTGSGNVSATAQPIVSNDGINWTNYGSAISATAAASVSQANGTGSAPWAFYSATITAISGTGAVAKLIMNA